MAFCFPRNSRKSIYGGKYTKDHYLSFVFPAACSPSFVIPATMSTSPQHCSVYWTTLCLPPTLFRRSRTLSAHWRSTSSTPPTIATFVKVSPSRACNDYNLNFLCWCEMTNLSVTFFISQTFALSLTDINTFIILKSPCWDSWDIQGQSLSRGSKAFSCTTLLPGLDAHICLATF